MATLTIRNVDDDTHRGLRLRAAENKRSVEEEVRRILAEQVGAKKAEYRNPKSPEQIAAAVKALREHFAPLRGSYSVDQFIAEKREEAAREFADEPKKFTK